MTEAGEQRKWVEGQRLELDANQDYKCQTTRLRKLEDDFLRRASDTGYSFDSYIF